MISYSGGGPSGRVWACFCRFGAAAFAVNTGENCGGPVLFDAFVFWRGPVLSPAALSFRRRSRRPGEPLLIFVDGDAAFLPADVGRGIVRKVSDPPWLPEARHTYSCGFQARRSHSSMCRTLAPRQHTLPLTSASGRERCQCLVETFAAIIPAGLLQQYAPRHCPGLLKRTPREPSTCSRTRRSDSHCSHASHASLMHSSRRRRRVRLVQYRSPQHETAAAMS